MAILSFFKAEWRLYSSRMPFCIVTGNRRRPRLLLPSILLSNVFLGTWPKGTEKDNPLVIHPISLANETRGVTGHNAPRGTALEGATPPSRNTKEDKGRTFFSRRTMERIPLLRGRFEIDSDWSYRHGVISRYGDTSLLYETLLQKLPRILFALKLEEDLALTDAILYFDLQALHGPERVGLTLLLFSPWTSTSSPPLSFFVAEKESRSVTITSHNAHVIVNGTSIPASITVLMVPAMSVSSVLSKPQRTIITVTFPSIDRHKRNAFTLDSGEERGDTRLVVTRWRIKDKTPQCLLDAFGPEVEKPFFLRRLAVSGLHPRFSSP